MGCTLNLRMDFSRDQLLLSDALQYLSDTMDSDVTVSFIDLTKKADIEEIVDKVGRKEVKELTDRALGLDEDAMLLIDTDGSVSETPYTRDNQELCQIISCVDVQVSSFRLEASRHFEIVRDREGKILGRDTNDKATAWLHRYVIGGELNGPVLVRCLLPNTDDGLEVSHKLSPAKKQRVD